ncbi:hypothetical protein PsYK624_160160 [Phanerochaete sordida]|uniref:F-box domain-containing protein n=1 Tax=Phanerochaete sordida TaxID=48140 RepID=A0A9P3LLV1_9APHY|nr:hypothetical protein PsYK624_160160 [Phanerochaete sordida]
MDCAYMTYAKAAWHPRRIDSNDKKWLSYVEASKLLTMLQDCPHELEPHLVIKSEVQVLIDAEKFDIGKPYAVSSDAPQLLSLRLSSSCRRDSLWFQLVARAPNLHTFSCYGFYEGVVGPPPSASLRSLTIFSGADPSVAGLLAFLRPLSNLAVLKLEYLKSAVQNGSPEKDVALPSLRELVLTKCGPFTQWKLLAKLVLPADARISLTHDYWSLLDYPRALGKKKTATKLKAPQIAMRRVASNLPRDLPLTLTLLLTLDVVTVQVHAKDPLPLVSLDLPYDAEVVHAFCAALPHDAICTLKLVHHTCLCYPVMRRVLKKLRRVAEQLVDVEELHVEGPLCELAVTAALNAAGVLGNSAQAPMLPQLLTVKFDAPEVENCMKKEAFEDMLLVLVKERHMILGPRMARLEVRCPDGTISAHVQDELREYLEEVDIRRSTAS